MRRSFLRHAATSRTALAAGLGLLALAAAPGAVLAQASGDAAAGTTQVEITRTDGDWQTVCQTGTQAGACLMRQVGKTAEGQEVLEMTLRRVEPQQTQQGTVEAILSVRVPLGVLLAQGLSIQIDQSEPQVGRFAVCSQEGCLLREPLPNPLVEAMRRGVEATVSFVVPGQTEPQRLDGKISLRGFTAAFAALKP